MDLMLGFPGREGQPAGEFDGALGKATGPGLLPKFTLHYRYCLAPDKVFGCSS